MKLTEFKEPTIPKCSGEYIVTVLDLYYNTAFESYAFYQNETKTWTLFSICEDEETLEIKTEKQTLNALLTVNWNMWMIVDHRQIDNKGKECKLYNDDNEQISQDYIDKCYDYLIEKGYMTESRRSIILDDFTEAKKVEDRRIEK